MVYMELNRQILNKISCKGHNELKRPWAKEQFIQIKGVPNHSDEFGTSLNNKYNKLISFA